MKHAVAFAVTQLSICSHIVLGIHLRLISPVMYKPGVQRVLQKILLSGLHITQITRYTQYSRSLIPKVFKR